ncbi:MAG: hypothetical protein AAF938_22980 [Myxococcota bacterium]
MRKTILCLLVLGVACGDDDAGGGDAASLDAEAPQLEPVSLATRYATARFEEASAFCTCDDALEGCPPEPIISERNVALIECLAGTFATGTAAERAALDCEFSLQEAFAECLDESMCTGGVPSNLEACEAEIDARFDAECVRLWEARQDALFSCLE